MWIPESEIFHFLLHKLPGWLLLPQFDADALEAIADKALERKTGARGLRAIMEAVTLDLMYHIPSDESITECEITKDLVEEKLSIEEQKLKTIEEK